LHMHQYKVLIDSGNWLCQSNLVLCSSLYKYLQANNHQIVHDPSEADYIIINSCGVFDETENVSIDLFKKYYSLKKKSANIIICGCLPKINNESLKNFDLLIINFEDNEKLDDIFFNTIKFEKIPANCNEKIMKELTRSLNIFNFTQTKLLYIPKSLLKISKKFLNNYLWIMSHFHYGNKMSVEIVERGTGCTGNCSYCVIKKAKKKIKSRKIEDILQDIKESYDSHKTLVLVADDCGGYGIDSNSNLPNLIKRINEIYPDLLIEIFYLNPIWIIKQSDQYIDVFKEGRISFSMITVESGSNKIIKNMNRNYDIKKVIKVLKKLKKVSPNTFFATNFVAGFPGETSIDFLRTLWISRFFDLPFPYPYQDRKGAESVNFPKKKSYSTINFRFLILFYICRINIFLKLLTFSKKNKSL
jgi:tRNA A37 methylthiotransferase MiaB